MRVQQIRSATIRIEFAGKRFLVDPMLSEKGAFPGFEGTVNSHLSNPTVDLPVPMKEILDVDAVMVTHTHLDHWDDAAKKLVPKDILLFAQNRKDADEIRAAGFRNVRALEMTNEIEGVTVIKTAGQHGRGKALEGPVGEILGQVSGIVFKHATEKTLYVAGDTVWCRDVAESLEKYDPDVVVLNCGDAKIMPGDSIIMAKQDVHEVCKAARHATIVASHMEAVNHATLSRRELREFLEENGLAHRVRIPADGEACWF